MVNDLRYAFRVLAKDFGFAAVAILTLGLGIGANTAIFTVVDALLLRPLPFPQSSKLVTLYGSNPKRAAGRAPFSLGRLQQLQAQSTSFSRLAGSCGETFNLTGVDQPEQLQAARVSADYLAVLGIQPILGRDFLPGEDSEGGKRVVLLSYGLWQRRFGGSPNIVGAALTLDSTAYTVIGVLPAGLDQPQPGIDLLATDLSAFSPFTRQQIRDGAGYITITARLKDGEDPRKAQAEMDVLNRQYLRDNVGKVDADPGAQVVVESLKSALVDNVKPALLVLCGAVGAVLLIACANIASLLLARSSGRQKELAVRAALGASRTDLIRQLLAESALLSLASGVLGLLLAEAGTRMLDRASQLNLPRIQEVHLDWQALLFTLLISLLASMFFGLIPSLQVSRPDLNAILRESSRGTSGSKRRYRTRSVLVVGQIALSMVLLIAASLLIRSFLALQHVDLGFDPQNVLTMQVSLPAAKYRSNPQQNNFFEQVLTRISAIPGVRSASASLWLPLTGIVVAPVQRSDDTPVAFGKRPLAYWESVAPDYFRAMNIRLLRGRMFTAHDNATSAPVAIVSESMARKFWPGQDSIGKQLVIARAEIRAEVVGVVADVKALAVNQSNDSEMYSPYAQRTWPSMALVVRASGDPASLIAPIRNQISNVDPDLPVTGVRTMDDIVSASFGQRRVTLWLFAAFAATALLLAAVGIYGLLAYSVAQRRQEMGIRRALGAKPANILVLVLSEGLVLALIGIAIGVVSALAITRTLSSLLYNVSPTDPSLFIGVTLVFIVVAAAASYLPARRAIDVNPLAAMRD